MTDSRSILDIRDLKVHFRSKKGWLTGRKVVKAVDGVSLKMKPGEIYGLVGESGSGKSTLGRAVVQLLKPTEGIIQYKGKKLDSYASHDRLKLKKEIQIVFQDPFSSLNPRMQIRQLIAEPLLFHGLIGKGEVQEAVTQLLAQVGLEPYFMYRYPHEMSGGQRQRIAIARVMGLQPKLIIADEPVSALDTSVKAQVLHIFKQLQQRTGATILLISHDLGVIQKTAQRIAVMKEGLIVEEGDTLQVMEQPSHEYTRLLLDSRVQIPF